MIPLFAIMEKIRLRTINTDSGNYHIIIVPNANILVHSEQNSVFKYAKNNKKKKTDEIRPKKPLKHVEIKNRTKPPRTPTHTYTPKLKIDRVLNDRKEIRAKRYVPENHCGGGGSGGV